MSSTTPPISAIVTGPMPRIAFNLPPDRSPPARSVDREQGAQHASRTADHAVRKCVDIVEH